MKIDETLIISGIFQKELKNRFRCVVKIDDIDEICYVSSSCRLTSFIDLYKKEVLLTPNVKSNDLQYTLFAVNEGTHSTILNLAVANAVIFEQLHRRPFSFLGKRKSVHREKLLEGYKADIFIEDTRTAIEIKAIISSEKQAIFPAVHSERGLRQLDQIGLLLQKGYKVCYLFASLSSNVKSIVLDRATPFYSTFINRVNCGMLYYGCSLKIQNGEIRVASALEVIL